MITPIFLFSLVWSLGASCDHHSRVKFDRNLRETLELLGYPRTPYDIPPEYRDVYSYFFSTDDMEWVEWMSTQPLSDLDLSTPFNELIVPTADTVNGPPRLPFSAPVLSTSTTCFLFWSVYLQSRVLSLFLC